MTAEAAVAAKAAVLIVFSNHRSKRELEIEHERIINSFLEKLKKKERRLSFSLLFPKSLRNTSGEENFHDQLRHPAPFLFVSTSSKLVLGIRKRLEFKSQKKQQKC